MSNPYKDNTKLIESLKKGEEKAYVYLVNTFNKPIYIYILALTNNHAHSEDLVQTVFMKVWTYRARLNQNYSIKSFLYKTAYNEFINHYHRNRALSNLEKAYMESIEEIIDDNSYELLEKKIALVTEGIKKLPKKSKEVFMLSKKEGLTNIEIAEYMNVSIKTVEGHITKAYSLLRTSVGNHLKHILFILFDLQKNEPNNPSF